MSTMGEMTAVAVLVGLLMFLGVVGAVMPWLPGTPLILLGALVWASRPAGRRSGPAGC